MTQLGYLSAGGSLLLPSPVAAYCRNLERVEMAAGKRVVNGNGKLCITQKKFTPPAYDTA